nr:MAG TPA: MqsA [Caudoviricetes sp.]
MILLVCYNPLNSSLYAKYMHYPIEKRMRPVWQCKVCNRLFVFI